MRTVALLSALVFAWASSAAADQIVEVRLDPLGGRQVVRIVTAAKLGEVKLERTSEEIRLTIEAELSPDVVAPAVVAPIESVQVEADEKGHSLILIRVPSHVPHEIKRETRAVLVILGQEVTQKNDAAAPSMDELYRGLFPAAPSEPLDTLTSGEKEQRRAGLGINLGPISLTVDPTIVVSYVDAEVMAGDSPTPYRDRYFQVQPPIHLQAGTSGEVPIGLGKLRVEYEPRFRFGTEYELLRRPTHLFTARLDWPIGDRIDLYAREHYAIGTVEANEVDPGGEYFYQLARFRRHEPSAGATFEITPLLTLVADGNRNRVRFDEKSGFFNYETQELRVGLSATIAANTQATLRYGALDVPAAPDRSEVEAKAKNYTLEITGEPLPLVKAHLMFGRQDRTCPQAGVGGERFRGWISMAEIQKEFSRGSTLRLAGTRSVELSAFEQNAFYEATVGQAEMAIPLPWRFAFRLGSGYHVNRYRTQAAEIGAPRRDSIFGWSVGLGRTLNRRLWLRGDFRRDRRRSNLARFNTKTDAILVQVGLNIFGWQGE